MKGQISKALCTEGYPGLLDATKHNEIAHGQAKEFLRLVGIIGKKTATEMSSSDRVDAAKCDRISLFLLLGEDGGKF